MRINDYFWPIALCSFALFRQCLAAPPCVNPTATNFVVASAVGDLTLGGFGGSWLLQNVDTNERIFLRDCSNGHDNTCYFATDVKPGKYYFQEAVPDANNHLSYPVSTSALWFPITGMGVDYIGHWIIHRQQQLVSKLQIQYELKDLDSIVELCQLKNRKLYLDRTKSAANQIVD